MADYDNTNQGALHPCKDGEKVVRQGTVNIAGHEREVILIQKTIPDKKNGGTQDIFQAYVKAGDIYMTDKTKAKDPEKASDMDGYFKSDLGEHKVWYRARVSKNNNKYTAVSFGQEKGSYQNGNGGGMAASAAPAQQNISAQLDDDIPF